MRAWAVLFSVALSLAVAGCGVGGSAVSYNNDHAYALAVQSDGKIVAAGDSYNPVSGWHVALMRFNADGSLDNAFGNAGKALPSIYGGARSVAIQGDGKIVVGGVAYDGLYVQVARYNSNGSLDAAFGSGGTMLTVLNGGIAALAIQSDGKIVAAGYTFNGIGYDFALLRYNSNGTLDTTFGTNGIVRTPTVAYTIYGSGADNVAIQSDGRIIAAGGSYLVRYTASGTLDNTFGTGGVVLSGSYYEQTSGLAIQTDGKVVAAGASYNFAASSNDIAVSRYNSDGSPDTTFAGTGRMVATIRSLYVLAPANAMVETVSGRIVAAAYSQYQSAIVRYISDGTPDATFNSGGKMILANGSNWGGSGMVRSTAIQGDGKILIAGSAYVDPASGDEFALERFNSDGSVDTGFGNDGVVFAGL